MSAATETHATEPDAPRAPASSSPFAAIGWAFFLASSWTWCIGMFLPVLLVEDFGVWGWIVFAIPNVLGAMAVGLASPLPLGDGLEERVVSSRPPRTTAFSLATIAFHLAFLVWMTPIVFAPFLPGVWLQTTAGFAATLVVLAGSLALSRRSDAALRAAAAVVYAFSLACFALAALASNGAIFAPPPATGAQPPIALLAVAPALAFGFLLCPQLDLTLRRARDATTGAARPLAFVLGFGLLFLAMIAASLLYAGGWIAGWINSWIIVHFAGQSLFTMASHLRELREAREHPHAGCGLTRWTRAALALGLAAGLAANIDAGDTDGAGRLIYQGFLSLYAVVFPVFVWTRILTPRRRSAAAPTRATLLTILVAWPIFASGHLTRTWWLLGLGLGLALALPVLRRAFWRARIA